MFKRIFVAVAVFMATLCFMFKADAAKSDQWIIYWYVCGTDIETTRIALHPDTDLMSDDPKALILVNPEVSPGDASLCFNEVDKASLSPNVKIFLQAGGTYVWGHEKFRENNAKLDTKTALVKANSGGEEIEQYVIVDDLYQDENTGEIKRTTVPVANGKLSRYLYDKDNRDWKPRQQLPISGEKNSETDMGSQVGLVSFLKAGQELERELYPDGNVRRIFIFVDHGQGSVNHAYFNGVVCKDEYTNNMLSLKEVHDAFAEVKSGWKNANEKPFEVVAFDTCLMSTYESAVALEDVANYMVASQEVTYGVVMLDYTELLNVLSKNPTMSGEKFGKLICDTCWNKSNVADAKFNVNTNAILTECVTDLSKNKMDALKNAYSRFGAASLNVMQKNPDEFIRNFTKFKKTASGSEKYPSQLYFIQDMIDLKDFVKNAEQNFPELKPTGDALVAAIKNSVIYQRRGNYLNRGGGLSTYYPFDLLKDGADIASYQQLAQDKFTPESQSELYGAFYNTLKDKNFDLSNLKDVPVVVDANKKTAQIEIDAKDLQCIEDVRCQMIWARVLPDDDGVEKLQAISLGEDSNMKEDWKNGRFESVFRNKWITLDDNLLFVQLVYDSTVKNKAGKKISGSEFYVSPILLNGQPYKLFFTYDYPNENLTLIGATPNEDGKIALPSTMLENLENGDVVTPIYDYFAMTDEELKGKSQSGQNQSDENLTATGNQITISSNSKIEIQTIPDGKYLYVFEFVNPTGGENETTNAGAVFTVKNGKVVDTKHFNDIKELNDLKN
ncbi:MAG: hypothetical protein IJQ82_07075 [Selenomonadaceae bacterium]|nr:hypothetical protein [Selenomonadaceae bacterium]